MALATLYIRRDQKDKNGECKIYIQYFENKQMLRVTTGKSVHPDYWQEDNKDTPINPKHYDAAHLNSYLRRILTEFNAIVDEHYIKRRFYPSVEDMRKLWSGESEQKPQAHDLLALFTAFMKRQHYTKKTAISMGTVRINKATRDLLTEYFESRGMTPSFDKLNEVFIHDFSAWVLNEKRSEPNTLAVHMTVLRTFLRWCNKKPNSIGFPQDIIDSMKVKTERKGYTILSLEDIYAMSELDLSFSDVLGRVRDAAVLSVCVGGPRVSDLEKLAKTKISRVGAEYVFSVTTTKTNDPLNITIPEYAYPMLERRLQSDTKWIPDETTMNRGLKEIGFIMGMTELVTVKKVTDGVYGFVDVPKYKTLTTHTLRRSLINILRLQGEDDYTISQITGQSVMTVARYQHVQPKEGTQAMRKMGAAFNRLAQAAKERATATVALDEESKAIMAYLTQSGALVTSNDIVNGTDLDAMVVAHRLNQLQKATLLQSRAIGSDKVRTYWGLAEWFDSSGNIRSSAAIKVA